MTDIKDKLPQVSRRARLGIGAAVLLALGAAGGAGAVSLTRPSIEMAPTVNTAINKLSASSGIVTVRGKVAEVFGDRFVIQDQTGRTMVDAGRGSDSGPSVGQDVTVQGRFDNGQFHASYLVGPDGRVSAIGPAGGPLHGPGGPGHPRPDGPPPPPPSGPTSEAMPPAPVDCASPMPRSAQDAHATSDESAPRQPAR